MAVIYQKTDQQNWNMNLNLISRERKWILGVENQKKGRSQDREKYKGRRKENEGKEGSLLAKAKKDPQVHDSDGLFHFWFFLFFFN
jgi:hypothetical protein